MRSECRPAEGNPLIPFLCDERPIAGPARPMDGGRVRSRRKITVSLLESAGAPAHGATRGLASVGWKIRPFSDLTAFLIYVKMNRPEVTIVPHRGQRLNGLKIAQRLRDLSPSTSVIIALQPCHSPARSLLSSSDLVSLIRQRCIAKEGAEIQGNGSMQWKGGKA